MVSLHSGLAVGLVRATRLQRQDTSSLKIFSVEVIGLVSPALLSTLQNILTFLKPGTSTSRAVVSHTPDAGGVPTFNVID